MFNSYQTNQNMHINAINGTIVKNYKKSFFIKFNLNDRIATRILNKNPYYCIDNYNAIPVVILQMMMCGDMEVVAEIISKSDFDEVMSIENNNK